VITAESRACQDEAVVRFADINKESAILTRSLAFERISDYLSQFPERGGKGVNPKAVLAGLGYFAREKKTLAGLGKDPPAGNTLNLIGVFIRHEL